MRPVPCEKCGRGAALLFVRNRKTGNTTYRVACKRCDVTTPAFARRVKACKVWELLQVVQRLEGRAPPVATSWDQDGLYDQYGKPILAAQ